MCGWFYLDTMHADRANLIMRYLSIQWSELETENTVATVRISRSFLWYAMNELMHKMQEQIDAYDARTKWCIWCKNDFFFFFWYMDGHSSHLPWLNHGWKIECLQYLDLASCVLYLKLRHISDLTLSILSRQKLFSLTPNTLLSLLSLYPRDFQPRSSPQSLGMCS